MVTRFTSGGAAYRGAAMHGFAMKKTTTTTKTTCGGACTVSFG